MANKTCTDCGATKPHSEFHAFKASADGRRPRCKACEAVRNRAPLRNPVVLTQKECSACHKTKPAAEFAPSLRGKGGLTGQCRACRSERAKLTRKANPEQAKARDRRKRASRDPKKVAAQARAWRAVNAEAYRERRRQYRDTRPGERERARAATREWVKANLPRKLAHNKTRMKRTRQATPPWVDRAAIMRIYLNRPPGHEVDHIVPLVGRTPEGWRVCGLHVPWNLQYLPKLANRRKHARLLPPGMTLPFGLHLADPASTSTASEVEG